MSAASSAGGLRGARVTREGANVLPGEPRYVIIGASLAGGKAAETLREEGFSGEVVLVGTEPERPYERPPLSKGLLLGKEEKSGIYVHDEGWYGEHDVDLRLGTTAIALDRASHQVELSGGQFLRYDKLLIATGSSPRRLNAAGSDLDGLLYLRTVADSERLAETLRAIGQAGDRVVIVGAGWIGLETAAAAREYGCEVIVVEPEEVPLKRALGAELGGMFGDLHCRHGVEFRFGTGVTEFRGAGGKLAAVVTSDGSQLPAAAAIIGIGVVPNVSLAKDAGLDATDGIVVDEALRTSDPDIYAAGDVANAWNPLLHRRVRVEHWANALDGGPAAARSMLGQQVSFDKVPYFFSDQYELGMETAGLPPSDGEDVQIVYRGQRDSGEFIAFWVSRGRVLAGMNVNVWDVNDAVQSLIRRGAPVDTAKLANPDIPLEEVSN